MIRKTKSPTSCHQTTSNQEKTICRLTGKLGLRGKDDDRVTTGNPGATKARAAAIAAGALLALPQWPVRAPETLTDFNDLAQWIKGVCHD